MARMAPPKQRKGWKKDASNQSTTAHETRRPGFQFCNKYKPNPSFTPKWSDKPLLKSWQKTKPPLGWPRETDSLCPGCVKEAREQILDGKTPLEVLYTDKPGEIKAQVI